MTLDEVTGIEQHLSHVELVHESLALRTRSVEWRLITLAGVLRGSAMNVTC